MAKAKVKPRQPDWQKEDQAEQKAFATEERKEQKIATRKRKREMMLSDADMFLLDCVMLSRGYESPDECIQQLIREAHKALPQVPEERNFT